MKCELPYEAVDAITIANLTEQLVFVENQIAELQSIEFPTSFHLNEVHQQMVYYDALVTVLKMFNQ